VIRRVQLLEPPGDRFSFVRRVAAAAGRIREGLLRDNKVVPPVLAVLALLIFAWVAAGALLGESDDPGEGGEEQVSSQASLAQRPDDSKNGKSETPAPEVENRDSDSVAKFEKKNPFRLLPELANEKGKNDDKNGGSKIGPKDDRNGGKIGDDKGDRGNGDRNGSDRGGGGRAASDRGERNGGRGGGDGDEGFIEQSFPGEPDPGFDDRPGNDGPGRVGGSGNLFDSGGDLPLVP